MNGGYIRPEHILFGTVVSLVTNMIVNAASGSMETQRRGNMALELIGYNWNDMAFALNAMEASLETGERARLRLCTNGLPSEYELEAAYLDLIANGFHVSRPIAYLDGEVAVTDFKLAKGSPAWAALIPLIVPILTVGLIAFGIMKIQSIGEAVVKIILVAGVVVVTLAFVARKPAQKYLERGGKIPLAPSTKRATPVRAPKDGWDNFLGRDYKKGDSVFWVDPSQFQKELPPFLKEVYVTPASFWEMVEKYKGPGLVGITPKKALAASSR